MIIGIDISQIVYKGTGVGRYVREMVRSIVKKGKKHTFILFGSSMRQKDVFREFVQIDLHNPKNVRLVIVPIPPTILHIMWNILHILPIETFTGSLDVFWSSDWTQPPARKAKLVTTVHDLSPLLFPQEHDATIRNVHAKRLKQVIRECNNIFCDSESTKKDCIMRFHIADTKLSVMYPGI